MAAQNEFRVHPILDVQPRHMHWAKPFAAALARSGVDVFFAIAGFLIYHVAGGSAAQAAILGHVLAFCELARKRLGLLS